MTLIDPAVELGQNYTRAVMTYTSNCRIHTPIQPIKIVTVGDVGVGKTSLLFRHFKHIMLPKWLPIVFDSYSQYVVIDMTHYNIQPWDTAGGTEDHDRLRPLSYPETDVVIVCYAVDDPTSLSNVTDVWLPELSQYIPRNVPLILLGTKSDLRRGPDMKKCIAVDAGYKVAQKNDMYYAEASALTQDGLKALFDKAIDLAIATFAINHMKPASGLINRKKKTNIKLARSVRPCMPEAVKPPWIDIKTSVYSQQMANALTDRETADVFFIIEGAKQMACHKVILCSASTFFCKVFGIVGPVEEEDMTPSLIHEEDSSLGGPCISLLSSLEDITNENMTELPSAVTTDKEEHLQAEDTNLPFSHEDFANDELVGVSSVLDIEGKEECLQDRDTNLAFTQDDINAGKITGLLSIADIEDKHGRIITQITLSDDISFYAFSLLLDFLYSGAPKFHEGIDSTILEDVRRLADFFRLPYFKAMVDNIENDKDYLNASIATYVMERLGRRAKAMFLDKDTFSDVKFHIHGSNVPAHKVFLKNRCDVMATIFGGQFVESTTGEATIQDDSEDSFMALLEYIYTDQVPLEELEDPLDSLIISEKYNQERLKNLCELYITKDVDRSTKVNGHMAENIVSLLHLAETNGAVQLANWCLHLICSDYLVFKEHKEFCQITRENMDYITENCWPPASYLAHVEEYEQKIKMASIKPKSKTWSCFCCFSGTQ